MGCNKITFKNDETSTLDIMFSIVKIEGILNISFIL